MKVFVCAFVFQRDLSRSFVFVLFSVFGYMKMFLMVLDFILWRREGRTVLEFPLQLACALCCC